MGILFGLHKQIKQMKYIDGSWTEDAKQVMYHTQCFVNVVYH